jgi:RNA polymerase sigma-70 factor (ECF subfamily)
MPQPSTGRTTLLLRRLRKGDDDARNQLLDHASKKLRRRARQMLRNYPGVRRWEQTDDVLQKALFRLHQALATVPLDSPRHFWNLGAVNLQWALIDLARRYRAVAAAVLYTAEGDETDNRRLPFAERPDRTLEPASLDDWTEFHLAAQSLPEEEREVFHLLWYLELTQQEAAELLGISLSTLGRRWRSATVMLFDALGGHRPK